MARVSCGNHNTSSWHEPLFIRLQWLTTDIKITKRQKLLHDLHQQTSGLPPKWIFGYAADSGNAPIVA
jgi:hypothetical protein